MKYPYSTQERPAKNKAGKIIYVQFRDSSGKYLPARSSGQTSKTAAKVWADEQLKLGQVIVRDRTPFSVYAEEFFLEHSSYVRHKRNREHQLGEAHLRNQNSYVQNYLIPYFGRKKLREITENEVDKLRVWLKSKNLTNGTINHILTALGIILTWAYREKLIPARPLIEKSPTKVRVRGCLTKEEVGRLFLLSDWPENHRIINLLAYFTGMRQGEILGLRRNAFSDDFTIIQILGSWERVKGWKSTKNGKPRAAALPGSVAKEVKSYIEAEKLNAPDKLLFPGRTDEKPLDHKIVERVLLRQLLAIDITKEDRHSRSISFHSSRHFYNTLLVNANIPQLVIQEVLGHKSAAMTRNYLKEVQLAEVTKVGEDLAKIFAGGQNEKN